MSIEEQPSMATRQEHLQQNNQIRRLSHLEYINARVEYLGTRVPLGNAVLANHREESAGQTVELNNARIALLEGMLAEHMRCMRELAEIQQTIARKEDIAYRIRIDLIESRIRRRDVNEETWALMVRRKYELASLLQRDRMLSEPFYDPALEYDVWHMDEAEEVRLGEASHTPDKSGRQAQDSSDTVMLSP